MRDLLVERAKHVNSSPESSPPNQTPQQFYQGRVEALQQRLDQINQQSLTISRFRALTFVPALILGILGCFNGGYVGWWYIAPAAVLFAGFIALVKVYEDLQQLATAQQHRLGMNQTQLARLERDWQAISYHRIEIPKAHRTLSNDLNLFGRTSVFQLLSMAHTPVGREILRDWILEPATPEEIAARQEAAAILSHDTEFRDELDLRGRQLGSGQSGTQSFVDWAESDAWLTGRNWLIWLTRGLTAAVVLSIAMAIASRMFDLKIGGIAILLFFGTASINMLINVIYSGKAHDLFNCVASRRHSVQHYLPLFEEISALSDETEYFKRLKASMGKHPDEPIRLLRRLTKILTFINLRHSGFWGIPYIIAEIVFLVDFHLLTWLESWQQKHGSVVRDWLTAVGTLEAISSLATLAHDHPEWAIPDVHTSEQRKLTATALGHPLIDAESRVCNDVTLGPQSTFLLVTGSNMSGKSTLLRSIGANVALAQAGAPVCATKFELPPVRLATSMRVQDSLAEGVSFFMAELKRLKQIVDECADQEKSKDGTLLYLLDEILQGTNSKERQIAVARVIHHLLEHGAIGAVSTHDLELAANSLLTDHCQTVHFRETISKGNGKQEMTFDYLMRPGISPTTNALKLLEMVGLTE